MSTESKVKYSYTRIHIHTEIYKEKQWGSAIVFKWQLKTEPYGRKRWLKVSLHKLSAGNLISRPNVELSALMTSSVDLAWNWAPYRSLWLGKKIKSMFKAAKLYYLGVWGGEALIICMLYTYWLWVHTVSQVVNSINCGTSRSMILRTN